MSKRKIDNDADDQFGSKKAKLMECDSMPSLSLHPWLQLINDDIAYIIVDFLKLSATSLSALSLTCSRWHNQIDAILNKDLQRYLPVSYKECNRKRRNEAIERFSLLRSEASVDLQLFEFQEMPTSSCLDHLTVYGVPWAPHIVFVKSLGGFGIVDLNKGKVIVPFSVEAANDDRDSIYPLYAINEKRKQVVISTTLINADYKQDNINRSLPMYYEWLHVYNVGDNSCGSIEFVTKFCVKNDYAVYDNAMEFYAPPNLYLDGNGIIWHSVARELKRFSIDQNEEIETNFDLDDSSVMGIGELDNNVLLFCFNYYSSPISIFDTSLKSFIGELPDSESIAEDAQDRDLYMKVVVRNNLALVCDPNDDDIEAIYNLNPLKSLYLRINGRPRLSQSGNKIAKFSVGNAPLELYLREDDQFNLKQSIATQYSIFREFFWIDDDRLLSVSGTTFSSGSIMDKSLKYYDLPFRINYLFSRQITIVGNVVLIADLVGRKPRSLSIYRMKI